MVSFLSTRNSPKCWGLSPSKNIVFCRISFFWCIQQRWHKIRFKTCSCQSLHHRYRHAYVSSICLVALLLPCLCCIIGVVSFTHTHWRSFYMERLVNSHVLPSLLNFDSPPDKTPGSNITYSYFIIVGRLCEKISSNSANSNIRN